MANLLVHELLHERRLKNRSSCKLCMSIVMAVEKETTVRMIIKKICNKIINSRSNTNLNFKCLCRQELYYCYFVSASKTKNSCQTSTGNFALTSKSLKNCAFHTWTTAKTVGGKGGGASSKKWGEGDKKYSFVLIMRVPKINSEKFDEKIQIAFSFTENTFCQKAKIRANTKPGSLNSY